MGVKLGFVWCHYASKKFPDWPGICAAALLQVIYKKTQSSRIIR